MKNILLIILYITVIVFTPVTSFCFWGKKDTLHDTLVKTANNMNKKLPLMVDKETEAVNVHVDKHDLIFRYKLINYDKSESDLDQMKYIISTDTKNALCSTPETNKLLNQGVGEKFMYYDRNNIYLFMFYINKNDCK